MEITPGSRLNPFQETIKTTAPLQTVYSSTANSDSSAVNDHFFEDPFVCAGPNTSVSKLEEFVLQCKHMYLVSRDKPQVFQSFLLRRLIELRQLLYSAKERQSNDTAEARTTSSARTQGHDFRSFPAIRFLGTVCDSCSRTVKSPTGGVLLCRDCSVACHDSSACRRGLLRVCPSHSSTFLDVSVAVHFSASLSRQDWRCWSCHTPLRQSSNPPPAPPTRIRSSITDRVPSLPPSAEFLDSIAKMERTPDPEEVQLQRLTVAVQEMAGLFSPQLGPVLTSEDVQVVVAGGRSRHCRGEDDEEGGEEKGPCEARFCNYLGKFFCDKCHWGDEWCIPAKVFALGVTTPYPVSRDAVIALEYMWSRQQFRVPEPWQRWNPSAVLAGSLRMRANRLLSTYFSLCSDAAALRQKFEQTQPTWLLEQPFTYTMWTVEQVLNGSLVDLLNNLLDDVEKHVNSCVLCTTFGQSICLVCRETCHQPHQHCSAVCSVCHSVVHRSCVVPPLKDSLEEIRPELEALQSQSNCPASLKVEDVLENLYPAIGSIRCKSCCN